MWIHILTFAAGLGALYLGADWLVRGAARLAGTLGVSPLMVGLTIVAFGSSAPELVVGVLASAYGQGQLTVGNVIGSNILNIALILGLTAVIIPLQVQARLVVKEIPIMLAATLALPLLGLDGNISKWNAVLLLAGFAGYLIFMVRSARSQTMELEAAHDESARTKDQETAGTGTGRLVLLVILGFTGLFVGAQLVVSSSVAMARAFSVPEVFIGITIVAMGTSLPELTTSLLAAWRREMDIAVGNAVGSNIFNVLAILGVSAMIHPLDVPASLFLLELPVMILVALLLLPFARTGLRISRVEGAMLVTGYAVFAAIIIIRVL